MERGGLRIEYGNFRGNIGEGSYFLVQPAQIERVSNQVTDICEWIGPTVSEGRIIDAVNFTRGLRRPMKELRYRFAVQEVRNEIFHGAEIHFRICYRLFLLRECDLQIKPQS